MRIPFTLFVLIAGLAAPLPLRAQEPEQSVVKVLASVRFPDPTRPWAKGNAFESIGTGVVIEGKRILTNSHLVMYATEVHVQARPGDDKLEAKIEVLGPDVDLAVLTLKDDRFFKERRPLPRSNKLPKVQDAVTVYGFPIGGNDLSVTKGTVSRLDVNNYGSRGSGVVIQVTAPINPGNSGGPAVADGKMIGLVYARVSTAQNIGFIVPNEEIEIFLADIKDGRYDGKPMEASGFSFQRLENHALRSKFKLDANTRGVLVHTPRRAEPNMPLKAFDILTRIGKHDIDNAGMVQLDNGLRVPFLYLVPRLARDNAVPATIQREGKPLTVALPVTTADRRLLRSYQGEPLPYFIHGPLVFCPARFDDISIYSRLNPTLGIDNSPLVTRREDAVRFPGEELVVVSAPMFAHRTSKGYSSPAGKIVEEINGVKIKNLRHLVATLRDETSPFLTFRFADEYSEVLVFDRPEMEQATEEILEDNGIAPTRRASPDLMKVWRSKGGAGK